MPQTVQQILEEHHAQVKRSLDRVDLLLALGFISDDDDKLIDSIVRARTHTNQLFVLAEKRIAA